MKKFALSQTAQGVFCRRGRNVFQFQYDYTLEDMKALSRVTARAYRRKRVLIYRTALALLGAGYLATGGLLLSAGSVAVGLVLLAVGVLFAAASLFYHQGIAWRSKRMMVEGEGTFTVSLEEESIRGRSGKGESSYPYSAVMGAFRYQGRYFLFLDKRHAMLLPERGLTQGDPAALKSFLEEKLGKEIIEIH